MDSNVNPRSRSENLVTMEMEDELLIYDLKANEAFCLNKPAADVWLACDGTRSVSDLDRNFSQDAV